MTGARSEGVDLTSPGALLTGLALEYQTAQDRALSAARGWLALREFSFDLMAQVEGSDAARLSCVRLGGSRCPH